MRVLWIIVWSLMLVAGAAAQALHCPVCTGPNVALQYTGSSCVCATLSGITGPAGPTGPQGPQGLIGPAGPQGPAGTLPASACPADQNIQGWTGSSWVCTATKYLLAQ